MAFVGVLLADMALRGEVDLAEPVAHLLPAGARIPSTAGREITLLDLATHTSGLPRMPGNFPGGGGPAAHAKYATDQMLQFLSEYQLPRRPGEQYEYSNFMSLLGHALALRAEVPYEVLLNDRILQPLDMQETGVSLSSELSSRLTRSRNQRGEVDPYFELPAFVPSGGLKSTVMDLLKFAAANLSHDSATVVRAFAGKPRAATRNLGHG
jgi:CubicO group peptidase (beta-lactamase class C family)